MGWRLREESFGTLLLGESMTRSTVELSGASIPARRGGGAIFKKMHLEAAF